MTNSMLIKDKRYLAIVNYVSNMREMQDLIPTPGFKQEPSCLIGNEFYNLLWFQLITTPEGDYGWLELRDPEVLDGVYRQVILAESS